MKINNKKLSFLCTLLTLCMSAIFCAQVAYAENTGLTFSADEKYTAESTISAEPLTLEATVFFKSTDSGRGGVIFGNYTDASKPCLNFEIGNGGHPRLYIIDTSAEESVILDVSFEKVNVYNNEWTHIAIVKDDTSGKIHCYENGVLAQSKDMTVTVFAKELSKATIGGDNRGDNSQYFKGELRNVTLYSDIRTDAEITADFANPGSDTDALIGTWNMPSGNEIKTISDSSTNSTSFVLKNVSPFFSEKEPVKDYAYSFALVGDTQCLNVHNPKNMHYIYDWIAENAEEKKMKFVFQLGDITDKNYEWEYAVAKSCMRSLEGKVPYSIIRGNHDKVPEFDNYITQKEYGHIADGFYDNTMRNTYKKLTIGNIKYLIINLDIGTEKKVLEWAGNLIEQHPDHNVILTTHIYLRANGKLYTNTDSSRPTSYNSAGMNSDKFWAEFVSKYENIKLVLCGHSPSEKVLVVKSTGDHGNTVTQILVDPQGTDLNNSKIGGAGLVAMLYFSEDGSNVQVEYYSTVQDKFYREENQFSFDVEVVKSGDEEPSAYAIAAQPEEIKDTDKGSSPVIPAAIAGFIAFVLGAVIAIIVISAKKKKAVA